MDSLSLKKTDKIENIKTAIWIYIGQYYTCIERWFSTFCFGNCYFE